MQTYNILGICGSLRAESWNRKLLHAAIDLQPEGIAITEYQGLAKIPPYNQDEDGSASPETVLNLREAIANADAILYVSPEYNYGIPGVLKNAIDWASRPAGKSALYGKPAAIMGASTGIVGTARMQQSLRQTLMFNNCPCVLQPEVLVGKAQDKFDEKGKITDEFATSLVIQLLKNLQILIHQMKA